MRRLAPPADKPLISLKKAAFRLGDRLVFEDTNWTAHRGEQWAIVGPNGSGKSLFADGLRGRLPLVGGELSYWFEGPDGLSPEQAIGHVAFEDRKSELKGTVVQSRWNSFEEEASLRVRDYLDYEHVMEINPFEVHEAGAVDRARFERRLRRAIRLLQIERFGSHSLLSLSNGERQRVQLARALALPLRLLILDEPYTGLDAGARREFHGILERLLTTKLSVLLVTAREEDLPGSVTHVMRLENCRIAESGPARVVLARSRNSSRIGHLPRRNRKEDRWKGAMKDRSLRKPRQNLVELHKVTVRYGEDLILNDLTWRVREGESWALLGPNGSGKTTVLSLIQGDNPQAYVNEVKVFGRRRGCGESVWQLKRRIGWVSPELQLHFDENQTVQEAVVSGFFDTVGLFESTNRRQRIEARRWLRRLGLLGHAEVPLFSLSAGLQRMTLIARALVKGPRLLILDEPCQGLDREHRDLIVQMVEKLIRSRTVTAIFVTHRQEEIPPSIQRVLRLPRRN